MGRVSEGLRTGGLAELLGIPAGFHQAALIPTAYFTGETFKPAAREPVDNVLHVDRW